MQQNFLQITKKSLNDHECDDVARFLYAVEEFIADSFFPDKVGVDDEEEWENLEANSPGHY